jgi:hypothetical protein
MSSSFITRLIFAHLFSFLISLIDREAQRSRHESLASCPGLIILLSTLLALRASCQDVSPAITAPARLPMKIQARQTDGFAGFLSVGGGQCK